MGFFDDCEECCSPRAYAWRTAKWEFYYGYFASPLMLGYGRQCSNPFDRPPLLGTGQTTIPKQGDWIFLATSSERSYGILADGSLWGWGKAPLGDGTLNDRYHPHRIGSDRWKCVSTCETHTLGIKQDGTLWAWGRNESGQLGDGNAYPAFSESPRVMLNSSIASVSINEGMFQSIRESPTSVSFIKHAPSDPGSGATATCAVSLSVVGFNFEPNSPPNFSSQNKHYAVRGGSGYKSVPTVVVTPSVPDPCIITANCQFDVYGATLLSGGSGYGPDTAVVFSKNAEGDSATATCTVAGGVITSITPQRVATYDTPPTITFTGGGQGAVATPAIYSGRVLSLTISSGGSGYTSPPTITFEGGEPEVAASTFASMQAVAVNVTITNGGSGYTQPRGGIKTRLNFASGSSVDIGTVNLSPGGLSHVPPFESFYSISTSLGEITFDPFYITHDLAEIRNTHQIIYDAPYPSPYSDSVQQALASLNVTASLVSSEAPDVPLSVTFEPGATFLQARWKISKPSTIVGRTRNCVIRVFVPSFDINYTYPNIEMITPSHVKGQTFQSLVVEKGDASLYNPTGPWVVADRFDNTTIFKATSTELVPFNQWQETQQTLSGTYGTVVVDQVSGGEPIYPRLQYIPWGWTKNAQQIPPYGNNYHAIRQQGYGSSFQTFRNPPEWTSTVFHVKERCYHAREVGVAPATSFPDIATFFVDGDGIGGMISGSFTPSTGKTSYSVSQAGSGYTYEPSVTATTFVISPKRVGSESDWQSVVAAGGNPASSAGLRQDGFPMRWGTASSVTSFSPARVGFPLSAKIKDPSSIVNWESYFYSNYYVQSLVYGLPPSREVVNGLSPQTVGPVFVSPSADPWVVDRIITKQGSLSFAGLAPGPYDFTGYLTTRRGDIWPSWSRYCGGPQTIYTFSNIQSLTAAPTPEQGDVSTYQHFVPFPYEREAVLPELLPDRASTSTRTFLGSCFTSAPNLGPEVDCVLHSPGSCSRLFVDEGMLMAVSKSGEVWRIGFTGPGTVSHSPAHVYGESDESKKIDIKVYGYEADVIWEWATATREQEVVLLASSWAYGSFRHEVRSDTFTSRYLLPPTKTVENESSGWSNSISVSPYRSWKIVITNPGSGYKPGDVIRIKISGGKTFEFDRITTQTSAAEKETVKTGTLTYTYSGRVVGDTAFAGFPLSCTTYVSNGRADTFSTILQLPGSQIGAPPQQPHPPYVWSNSGAYGGRPRRRFSISLATGVQLGDSAAPAIQCDSGEADIEVIKKLTCHLIDRYETRLVDVPEQIRSNVGGYGYLTGITVADGGLYMNPLAFGNDVIDAPDNLFVTVPSVEIIADSGGGSGATAKLVPVRNSPDVPDVPLKVSSDANTYQRQITSANAQYGVTSGGLIQFNNPKVNAPPSHQRGITSLTQHLARTSSRDLLRLRSGTPLEAVRAFPNVELTLADAGKNYRLPPLISMPQPHASVAVAEAHISGKLVSLGVENGGSGYRYAPTLTLSGGEGTGATARAVISGPVDSVALTSGGSGYAATPKVAFSGAGIPATATAVARGYVSSIVIADGGSGYTSSPPPVVITGDGSGASAVATTSGRVRSVYLSSGGGGYDSPPTVTISGGGGSGATAVAHMRLNPATNKYSVSHFELTSHGSGYTSPPTVTVSPPPSGNAGAIPALAVAEVVFYVDSVTITSPGQGYSTPPAVTVLGGTARVFAFLSMSVEELSLRSGGTYRSPPSIFFRPVATVESVTLTSAGENYTRAPEVLIVGGGGSGAAAACTIGPDGRINKLTLTARGVGYRPGSAPHVVFVGGGGRGASATATVLTLGGGGGGTTTINGSILYAEPTAEGSGYQFSPIVTISGGGNQRLSALNEDLSAGRITQSQYDSQVDDVRGVVLARVEGAIDRIDITNAGDRYSSQAAFDRTALARIPARATAVGPLGRGSGDTLLLFNATNEWPGGGVSQPSSLPSAKFLQKPQIRFQNGIYAEVQDFYISKVTCNGLRTYPTRPTGASMYSGNSQASLIANGNLSFGSFNQQWSYGSGLSKFAFDVAPEFDVVDRAGGGAAVAATLNGSDKISGLSFTSQGSGYTPRAAVQARDGWIKVVPCQASCTINSSGSVTSVTISSPGDGYVSPVAIVHGGGGSGCVLVVDLVDGNTPRAVRSLSVSSGGSGYSQSNPPAVLVYDSSGSFGDSIYGQAFNESALRSTVGPFLASSYSGEYALPYSSELSGGDFKSASGPKVLGEFVFDGFQKNQSIENLSISLDQEDFLAHAYQSSPQVTVNGTCDRQASVAATVAKWTTVVDSFSRPDGYPFNLPHEFSIALRDTLP
jgi:hypothetical protein